MSESSDGLDVEVDEPTGLPSGAVLWLHGIGQDAGQLRAVLDPLGLAGAGVRSVYVNAPWRAVGLLQNRPCRAWFRQSVARLDDGDFEAIGQMRSALRRIVDSEAAQVGGAERLAIAGFSQGAAMALQLTPALSARPAGMILYAAYPVRGEQRDQTLSPGWPAGPLPIWLGHGRRDWAVPFSVGLTLRDELQARGQSITWRRYPGGHEPFAGAGDDLRAFILETLRLGRAESAP